MTKGTIGEVQLHKICDPWCVYLPHLHRALADLANAKDLPRIAERLNLHDACAVWETLHYLLTAILGWTSPGHGLAWWYQAGKPTDESPHLGLVHSVWNTKEYLDYYAAWAWTSGQSHLSVEDLSPAKLARASLQPDEDWWHTFKRRGRMLNHDPFYGGSNPLHLGHSDGFGLSGPEGDRSVFHFRTEQRRAMLIINHIGTWRHDLHRAAERLPSLGDRSWQIEVFDRQVGYLGLYRKSRVTGCWFAGKHSIHVRGTKTGGER